MGTFARPIVGNMLRIGLGLEVVLSFPLEVVLLLERGAVSLRIFRIPPPGMFRENPRQTKSPVTQNFSRLEDNLLLEAKYYC